MEREGCVDSCDGVSGNQDLGIKQLDPNINPTVSSMTGSGKTSFISRVTGRTDLKIGHDLSSCTCPTPPDDVTISCGANARFLKARKTSRSLRVGSMTMSSASLIRLVSRTPTCPTRKCSR